MYPVVVRIVICVTPSESSFSFFFHILCTFLLPIFEGFNYFLYLDMKVPRVTGSSPIGLCLSVTPCYTSLVAFGLCFLFITFVVLFL